MCINLVRLLSLRWRLFMCIEEIADVEQNSDFETVLIFERILSIMKSYGLLEGWRRTK